MPIQVDGAFVRAPSPVPSCPACEPNSGSVPPSLSTKATRVERGRHCYAIMLAPSTALFGNPTHQELAAGERDFQLGALHAPERSKILVCSLRRLVLHGLHPQGWFCLATFLLFQPMPASIEGRAIE